MAFYLSEIASQLNGRLVGDDVQVSSIGSLSAATAEQISFIVNPKHLSQLHSCDAAAVLIRENLLAEAPKSAIVVDDVYASYARLTQLFKPNFSQPAIAESVVIAPDVVLGKNVVIEANVVIKSGCIIGDNVVIGANSTIAEQCNIGNDSLIYPNVSVYYQCQIGQRCVLHSGCVIGSDGFGFAPSKTGWIKIEQLGAVVLGDDVEIGANACIDRGAIVNTMIESGVKIDNLVHIAHNCHIGKNTAIAAQSGIAGSTSIGENCTMGGQVGIAGHLTITDNVHFSGMSLVSGDIQQSGSYSSGSRLQPSQLWRKNAVRATQLDDLFKQVKQLQKRLNELEQQ